MENNTATRIADWTLPEVENEGTFVEIKDDCETYVAVLPQGWDFADAISDFSSSYDGEGNVDCCARLYVDGTENDMRQFAIEFK